MSLSGTFAELELPGSKPHTGNKLADITINETEKGEHP
jgi:hypothetical protein